MEIYQVVKSSNAKYLEMVRGELERRFDKIRALNLDVSNLPQPSGYEIIDEDESEQPLKKRKKSVAASGDTDDDALFKNLGNEEWAQLITPELVIRSLSGLDLKMPENVLNDVNGLFVETPVHGMCFKTAISMLFQRTSELKIALALHLYSLYAICKRNPNVSQGFEKFLLIEADRRRLDLTQTPPYEVKKEIVDM